MANTATRDQSFEMEREQIEAKHRNEILNLLKSFEFEKKDMEARFQEELEKTESGKEKYGIDVEEMEEFELEHSPQNRVQNDLLELEKRLQKEKTEQKVEFETEKENLLFRISELKRRIQVQGDSDGGSRDLASTGTDMLPELGGEQRLENGEVDPRHFDPTQNADSNTNDLKSLSGLETENRKLQMKLNESRDQILELKNQIKDFTQKIEDIEKLLEDSDFPADKKDIFSRILQGAPRETSSPRDVFESCSNSPESHKKSSDDIDTSFTATKLHRTSSVMSFQLVELNLENEDLKRNVYQLEQKLRKTVEENEIRVGVLNEKLSQLAEKIMLSENSEAPQESGFKLNLVDDLNNIRLERTSNELLEDYVSVILKQKLTAPSPDILNVNFCHELQSLEQILDIEIFDGRVFDSEMKDEVKQVLRDKEKELLVAYTLEKLRDEIRHRATTEGTLEELQKERERHFCIHQAVNEILKVHLGVSDDDDIEHGEDDNQEENGASQVHLGTSEDDKNAVNKILREYLGIGNDGDKIVNRNLLKDNKTQRMESQSVGSDIESLKTEKENLERNLQELQDYFENDRQALLEKLEIWLQGDSNDSKDKDKMIESLQARTVLMEQMLNTERFYLSRLYYMEMKEELKTSLKQHPFDRGTKLEKDRLVDAWKHHAEVGELYQEILSKEAENFQNLQTNSLEESMPQNDGDEANSSPRNELSREHTRLEQQLPVKLELLQLQRKRCRDHKAVSLILEQAVVALETAAQEQNTLLVCGDYFRRKSSWSSIEEAEDVFDVRKQVSPLSGEDKASNKDIPPAISNVDVENSNRKDLLTDALVKAFERLLNGQQDGNIAHADSCTSDSELSESSSRDVHSDDEGLAKTQNSENFQDASSTNNSPRTELKTSDDPEGQPQTHDDTSVPVIFKLPPRIENILNIERFNMSRLLRDEYVDKIRRGKQKLRQAKAKNEKKNSELVSKFHYEVKALLKGVEFVGEINEALTPQRKKLSATPSYDSGIVDPVEQDKDDVVKKYKELLEKARRDLKRAHRALRARNIADGVVKGEMAAMKRNVKEAKNDLDEFEEKRNDLDDERSALLGRIKDAQNSANVNNAEEILGRTDASELERDDNIPLQSELDSTRPKQSITTNADGEESSNAHVSGNSVMQKDKHSHNETENINVKGEKLGNIGGPATKSKTNMKNMDKQVDELQNKVKKLSEEKISAEEEIKELQRKLIAGTGGEDILKDLQEKLADVNDVKSRLEEKCSELENEMVEKDERFEVAMQAKEEVVDELQRKLVAGTGVEDVLQELKGKMEKAKTEKLEVEEKCSGLEKELKEKQNKLKKVEEEIETLERKSVEGTGAEEVVKKVQSKLNATKAEKEKVEEKYEEVEKRNKELRNLKEDQEEEINQLQKKLVAGTNGEEILKDLQDKLKKATEQNSSGEQKKFDLQQENENREKAFSDEKTKMGEEINELQRKLVAGTGGEEILKELQEKIQEAKEQNSCLEETNSELEKELEGRDKAFSDEVKEMKEEIIELQSKLVAGTGREEILEDVQKNLHEAKEKSSSLEQRSSELQAKVKEIKKAFCDKEKKLEDELNSLQRKLVDGTGGEEILAELQDKLQQAKDENASLQTKCEELEDKSRAKDKVLDEEIKRKENEIIDLQKKLISGTGGEEILNGLQDKLQQAKDENAALQTKCEGLEEKAGEKYEKLSDQIAEKENEISELQKKIVSGTGGEEILNELQEILNELQDELKEVRKEKAGLQTACDNLEGKIKASEEYHLKEIKEKQNEINYLQKKLIGGTGGEEILSELQDKLEKTKEENAALKRKCDHLKDEENSRNKELINEIEIKDGEIDDLQKKLVSGTGGEEIFAELQDKLNEATKNKVGFQARCEELEDMAREKDNEFNNQIKEKENEISNLQKKLVSRTGGEEILAELQDKLKETKEENMELRTTCLEFEKSARMKENDLTHEIGKKELEIQKLQKQLVAGTGYEEMLTELQDRLEITKEKNTDVVEECSKLEKCLLAKDEQLNGKIEQKDAEILRLQQKLVSGSGGEEILVSLQNQLKDSEKENSGLEETCSELSKELKLIKEKKENAEKVNDLQKKLITGTGSEEVLEELQNKLKETEMEKGMIGEKYSKLKDEVKKKDLEARKEKNERDEEVNNLQKKLLSGTGGEEILEELQEKLKEAEMEKGILQNNYSKLENEVKERDIEEKIEKAKQDEEIIKLQKCLISGTGGEDLLDELQEKLKHTEKEEQSLERSCAELDRDIEKKHQELQRKEDEVSDLQKMIVAGAGAENLLQELQEKLKDAKESEKAMEKKHSELENDLQTRDEKYAKQLNDKQEKINKLQRDLFAGTDGEEVLVDLQEKLARVEKETKHLEAELEKRGRQGSSDGDYSKEFKRLQTANEILENENKVKKDKIDELQLKMIQGTGGEDVLKDLQNDLSKANETNKQLQIRNAELEHASYDLAEYGQENIVASLKEDNERLQAVNDQLTEQLRKLQKNVVSGTGSEELLQGLQNEIKELNSENRELRKKKIEMEGISHEGHSGSDESKDEEICELQKMIADGSGAEELLKTVQEKIQEANQQNKVLEKRCLELESETVALSEECELLERRLSGSAEAETKIERLAKDCKEKDMQIVELQRKMVACTGGEEVLAQLQNQVKQLQGNNDGLERKLAKTSKDVIALEDLERKDKGRGSRRDDPYKRRGTDKLRRSGSTSIWLNDEDVSAGDNANYQDKNEAFGGPLHHGETEAADKEIDEPISYEECLQMIPEIKEEEDYWREKYQALRQKVGAQFVDTIPDVWNEETSLEKEREEIVEKLSKLSQEIAERETPVVKAVSEKGRIETELDKVEDDLEICNGNLAQLREMRNEHKLIEKNEEMLMEGLNELQFLDNSLAEDDNQGGKSKEVSIIRDEGEMEALERKSDDLYNELKEILTEEQKLKELKEKDMDCFVEEKLLTENDLLEIEAAIQNLKQGLSTQNYLKQSNSHFNRNLEGAMGQGSEEISDELEKIQHEIKVLQTSLENPSLSGGEEINNLLALMKEKSKLEDELTDTEKSLNQLGKREYETLVKERETHETVAKKLLELSREKEAVEGELQEVEALAQEKERELVKNYNTELKSREDLNTSAKKRRGFRKRKSSFDIKSEDSGAVSSAEEGFSDIDLGEPPLTSDAALALNEELGSLIQKQSSLAVRLEGLGKEITAQSLKVEKSLLGASDNSSGESSLGAGYVSVEDLSQSQISIFDDYNMVDELSLATNIVRDERVKRKSSRKAPLSKLLKEKSTLEKKMKETQGKVLVQNTKVKNALKEGQDAGKAKEKFVKAVQDRKSAESELANVSRKIDDATSHESSVRDKNEKTPKSGKSLSKNDKRRLLSQRESLSKQIDAIKKKIENFSVDGGDSGLADFPEMRETENIGNTIGKLRELIAREAMLKQELDRLTSKEGHDVLSLSTVERDASGEMLNKSGKIGKDGDRNVYTKGSAMISDSGDSSSLDEWAGEMLDSGDELGERGDKDGQVNDVGASSASDPSGESFDDKGTLKERFRDLGDQIRSANEKDKSETRSTAHTEVDLNKNGDNGKASLLEKDIQSRDHPPALPPTRIPKDTMPSSEQDIKRVADNSALLPDVLDLLIREKGKKQARLRDLEKRIENEKSGGDKTKDSDLVFQRKRENLENKMKLALKELQQRKEAIDELEKLLRTATKENDEDPEQALEENLTALTQQKEKLKTDLLAVKEELDLQTRSEDISADYQDYKDLKNKEKDLGEVLDKVNEKLHRRKEWTAVDSPGEEDNSNLAEAYADILKRMSDENLNMADLIHEMEETKNTLSKEREITRELLDLIKSRVGNELLEALMGEGLQSPSVEIREMGMFSGGEYPELLDEVENDTVTVAEVIDDYKKVNQFLFKENQKLYEKVELLKGKVDEDLLASIVNQEPLDIEASKKQEISKILENNKTLFEQIVTSQNEEVLNLEGEMQSLNREMEGVRKEKNELMQTDLNRIKEKVKGISTELDKATKRREELVQQLKELEKERNSSGENLALAEQELLYSTAGDDGSSDEFNESQHKETSKEVNGSKQNEQESKKVNVSEEKVGSSSDGLNDFQNVADLTREGNESRSRDGKKVGQEIISSLKEAEELEKRMDSELRRLNEELRESETEITMGDREKDQAVKQSDGLGSESNKQYGNLDLGDSKEYKEDNRQHGEDNRQHGEDNKINGKDNLESNADHKEDNQGLSEKISSVENIQKEFLAKLDEVQKLQDKLKREKELKAITQGLEKKLEGTFAKLNETNNERDEILEKFENLQKEKENIEVSLGWVENENIKLKASKADLEKDKEELTSSVKASDKAKDEIAAELKNVQEEKKALQEMTSLLEKENDEMQEKLSDLQNENEEISDRLNKENDSGKGIDKHVEDFKEETKSPEDLLDAQKKDDEKLLEEIRELQCGKDELSVKLHDADKIRQEVAENFEEKMEMLENENTELNEVILALKKENGYGIEKLNEINETLKENEERLKSLKDLEQENESFKERLSYFENENKELKNKERDEESVKEMLALLESENKKLTKEQEGEIEYLRKVENDFQLLNEKLKKTEVERENIKEDLGILKDEMTEIEDFVRLDMNQDVENGVISALERYREKYEETHNQNNLLKEEVERFKHIQNVVGESLSDMLLELPKKEFLLNDTTDTPRCVEELVKDNTLASVLNEYENDLDKVKQHLGEELFSLVVGKDANLESRESDQPVKIADDLRNGKHIKEIVKEYEDLINSQAYDLDTAKHLQDQVNMLEQELEAARTQKDDLRNQNKPESENVDSEMEDQLKPLKAPLLEAVESGDKIPKANQGYQNDNLMDIEYEDLLKKVMEHQAEIEEAEKLLHVQKAKHEADKQNMIEQFKAEKANTEQLINNERGSMEKAMQNLINEIVRLKEERNEIRKNNRVEKEKLVLAFENERTDWLSSSEEVKNEIEEKLEKKFQGDFEKFKKEMATRETELKEEMMKLKEERNDLASKLSEMEDKVRDEITEGEENEKLSFLEKESNEQIKNEFEEKMKIEKERFQETLTSLKQEIERLQKERNKAMDEISTKPGDLAKQTSNVSASEAVIYERLESEFRTKVNSEKMFMESGIKELRKENEVLNKQKQELKSNMRMERLELSKKYEREKEELAEKYRNELKTLRKNLEKTQASHEPGTPSTQNFYDLRRKIRDRDTKIQRYERFFEELNQEASILQRDSDMAV